MTVRARPYIDELRISPGVVLAALALSLVVLTSLDIPSLQALSWPAQGVYLLCLTAWLLGRWRPWLSRWLTIAIVSALVFVGAHLLGQPGLLSLLAIPTALTASLVGLPSAAITAGGLTLALGLCLGPLGLAASALVIPLLAIWAMLGIMATTCLPIYGLAERSWGYYTNARVLVDEARDRQAELHRAVDDLAYANQQLSLLNEKVSNLRQVAERAEQAKAAFLAKVSHEFRTPLNMIIGLTSLLTETPHVYGRRLPAKLLEHLGIVHRNCMHLSRMIDDVLDLSQVEAGKMALRRERVDLPAVIAWAVGIVRPLVDKKGLALTLEMPTHLEVECDRTRISQVVINLLSNAARFTDVGRISVRVAEHDGHVLVGVADTGPGISPEDAHMIFEPFCQGASGPWRDRGGSGLGLTISKQFVEMHGGRMWLESQLGMGSTFYFRLPLAPLPPLSALPTRWIQEHWIDRSSSLELSPVHLDQRLVLRDEAGDVAALFARYADRVTCVRAASVEEAVRRVQECPPCAVLLNLPTPEAVWPEVARAAQAMPDTPIIGCCVSSQAEPALAAGAHGYLVKPLTLEKLGEALRSVETAVQRVLVVDDGADDREVLSALLHALDGTLEVTAVASGQEALQALRRAPADLVMLDLTMPDMDGWQVLATRNEDDALRPIPVIIISAHDPRERPLSTRFILVTLGEGLSAGALLRCARQLPALLRQPD